ncbi:butyrophilin-like protein 2 [Epinephelus moara]|uniref:butyrophilin-like protein 2 n=1 Tax=Epinephelus moara TaxID=300413 RepID=UPI00214E9555|nr:butyrophilin-like protein 2 [Epinephelus moara]
MMNNVLSILIFLCSVFVLYADTGVTSQPITAVEGNDVTLQCPLAPGVDLSACTVDVSRLDLNVSGNDVHVYRKGKDDLRTQMAQYKDRTTLIHEDLTRGILTLTLSSVKLSDSGPYKVYVPKRNANCVIDLSVVPKDPQNRTRRDDSSTTKPPVQGVTKSDDGGAAKAEPQWKTVLIVCGCVAAAAAAAAIFGIVLLILWKLGKIKNCMRTNGGRMEQEANVTNGIESIPLRTTTQDDLNHDGPGNNVQVV